MSANSKMVFPPVHGSNLHRKAVSLPKDFKGTWNIVLIAFQQWQQSQVNTWLPFAQQVEADNPDIRYYELPTIRKLNAVARIFINEGMRAGIPDSLSRERTITLYTDKAAFKGSLGISSEEMIHILLLDPQDSIAWRSSGTYTVEKGQALMVVLASGRASSQ